MLFVLLISLTISGISTSQAQDMVTVYPAEYPEALSNPLKGFRPGDGDWNKYPYPTLVHDYIRWNEIENSASDGVDKIINFCDSKWNHLPAANIRVIPRVYIDWDSNTGNEYWPADLESGDWYSQEFKDRVVNLIYKLGEAWDNDPRVAWIQTGIIGYWGEQENPVGVDEDGWVDRMGEAYRAAFSNKLLTVRNQNYWDAGGYAMGVYWDSFAHPGQTSGSWTRIRNANARGRYLTHPIEGEVAYNWGGETMGPFIGLEPDITLGTPEYRNNLIDVIRELHCSALGWVASYSQGKPSVVEGAAIVQKEFGYRFVIPEFSCSRRSEPGGNLEINFKVINIGSTPFYENWPLAFVLIDESTHQIVWTEPLVGHDIRTWHPGDDYDYDSRTYQTPAVEHEINASVTVPAGIATGQYMAGLTILEPYSRTPGLFFDVENFLSESQSQPLCRIGIGEDVVGGHEINDSIYNDLLLDDDRYYTMEWNGPTFMLTMSAAAGGSISPGSGSYPENRNVRLEATAELGYVFSSWSGDLSGSTNPVTITMDSDMNVTANFTAVPTFTLTTNAANGTVVLDPAGGTYNEGTVVTIRVNPDLGYVFSNWSGDLTGSDNPATIIMDADKNVFANFTSAPIYTLTTSAADGSILLDPAGPRFTEGTVVKVEAEADPGYAFSGWIGDALKYSSWINPNFITMEGDKSISATFTAVAGTPVVSFGTPSDSTHYAAPANLEVTVNASDPGGSISNVKLYINDVFVRQENIAAYEWHNDAALQNLQDGIYVLKAVATDNTGKEGSATITVFVGNTDIENSVDLIPERTQLAQNYPNPFNPETTIPYQLAKPTYVKLIIYNFLGQRVATLVDEQQSAGFYSIIWNSKDYKGCRVSSGIYVYRLETSGTVQMKKFSLLQ